MTVPTVVNGKLDFLYKKQQRHYFQKTINQLLGLVHIGKMTISSQIVGNCSWANVQALLPVGCALQDLLISGNEITDDQYIIYRADHEKKNYFDC